MNITNSELKALLNLHNYLPFSGIEYDNIPLEYKQAIVRYEQVLNKLLTQKIQENQTTIQYIHNHQNRIK